MALPARDLRLLKKICDCGHTLEKTWEKTPGMSDSDAIQSRRALQELTELIRSCDSAKSDDLKRLAFHTRNLGPEMSARHLSGVLVPFERLLGRALRDDEFMITTQDREKTLEPERGALVVVADCIRSAFNVGAIMRTADCFAVAKVVLTGYTPTPDEDKTAKTSLGAEGTVPWESKPHAKDALAELKNQGYTVIALETAQNSVDLANFQWPEKPVLLLGNERFGIDAELLTRVDQVVRIPMHGVKNSLNVGIAFGIAAADWRQKLTAEVASTSRTTSSVASASFSSTANDISPIASFYTNAKHPYEARRQGALDESGEIGVIEFVPDHDFEQALSDLEGFERLWIIYRFHHNQNWKPMVMPPRGERIKRGVFATRSPYRPNPLGLTCAEVVKVEGRKVFVRKFDLLDGTPIYDIKPYVPYADSFPTAKTGWLERTKAPLKVTLEEPALEKMQWLETRKVTQFRSFLVANLEHDPLDCDRKRVLVGQDQGPHIIAYRTWRATFTINDDRVHIEDVLSGYKNSDLMDPEDRYEDKNLHREFNAVFPSSAQASSD